MDLAGQIERELRALGTADRARSEQAYLKSSLVHFGVPMPVIRKTVHAAARDLTREPMLAAVETLWARGIHELRVAAMVLLVRHHAQLGRADAPLVERLLRDSETWAYVDELSTHVMGPLVEASPALARTLDRWARDDNFWIRRAAMLSLLGPLRRGEGDFERFSRYADAMLDEREFFIRKAIGWVLREVGKKRPDLVHAWIAPRVARASGVTLREALKPLTPAQRARLEKQRTGSRPAGIAR